ncbi:MAG: hypothetical protein MUE69_31925 [Myxococcota bacterium]|nr:hypothetical protein [Myxococcota bacterium]
MASSHAIAWAAPTARVAPILGRRWLHTLRASCLASLVALAAACSSGASPTLPIPPPAALTSAPDEDGVVTITGNGAIEGALVSAYNERTERGVIETADDAGAFVLRLEAQTGDSILVWQRVGTQSGQVLSLGVP